MVGGKMAGDEIYLTFSSVETQWNSIITYQLKSSMLFTQHAQDSTPLQNAAIIFKKKEKKKKKESALQSNKFGIINSVKV